ncbi:MAG: ABC transporter permease subunit [Bacteroidetes bacterium]|nr:ABC transporter permease subunit [Bacteroidota bacterium]
MKQIWIIAKRELRSLFNSLLAYIIIIIFLGFSGFFTWLFGSDIFFTGQASLRPFFDVAYWTFFFFIPAMTMKLLAEENKTGTIELLMTKPVTDWQVVTGKFLSVLLLIIIALILSLPYYITVANIGPVDHGAVCSGYLGLILMSAAYISIGMFASGITNNQIVAFLVALAIGFLFHFLFKIFSFAFSGTIAQLFDFLSLESHYDSISRGVIDSRDVIYFLSIIFIGLFSSEAVLAKRNLV